MPISDVWKTKARMATYLPSVEPSTPEHVPKKGKAWLRRARDDTETETQKQTKFTDSTEGCPGHNGRGLGVALSQGEGVSVILSTLWIDLLGAPVVPFDPFLGEGSPTKIDYEQAQKRETNNRVPLF